MNRKLLYGLSGVLGFSALVSLVISQSSLVSLSPITFVQAELLEEPGDMTVSQLGAILQMEGTDLQGGNGQWQLTLNGQQLLVLADGTHNRMRIVVPITSTDDLTAQQVQAMLVANFHSALDARYAVTDGTVVSVFVHPLSSLQENDFRSGLRQVANLANTFGTDYTSGELGFGPDSAPNPLSPNEAQLEI